MQILRRMFLFPIFAGLLCLACNNPLQTQQTLDSWQNRLLTNELGFIRNPACSPDGETIAFTRERRYMEIYSRELHGMYSGGRLKTICIIKDDVNSSLNHPRISSDGTHVVYVTTDDAVVVENIQTGATTTIYQPNWESNYKTARSPQWLSGGQYVYYMVGNSYLEIASIDGSAKSRFAYKETVRDVSSFQLSSDGNYCAISGSDDELGSGYNIYLLSLADNHIDKLTNTPRYNLEAIWAPDDKSLAFFQADSNNVYDLVRIDPTGAILDTLCGGFTSFSEPFWSKDGSKIVFWARVDSTRDRGVFEYSLQRQTIERLFYLPDNDNLISLNPLDESTVLFQDYNTFYNISTITMDSVVTDITPPTDNEYLHPSWTPDGLHILYANDGNLYRVPKAGGEAGTINFDEPYNVVRAAVSPDSKYLAVGYDYSRTNIYDFKTLELLFPLEYKTTGLSWSPDSKKLLFATSYNIKIYQLENDHCTLLYVKSRDDVYAVDWSKTPSPSGLDILCCVDNGNYSDSYQYEILLLDEKLEKAYQFAGMYEEQLYGCWMPNGLDIIYSHESGMRIRRTSSYF